jgi:hypothetical protein
MFPKKVIINLSLIAIAAIAVIFVAKLIGGPIFSFLTAGVLSYIVGFGAVWASAATAFFTRDRKWSDRGVFLTTMGSCAVVALLFFGLWGAIGSVVAFGALYFRLR